jgi:hypothetical protein
MCAGQRACSTAGFRVASLVATNTSHLFHQHEHGQVRKYGILILFLNSIKVHEIPRKRCRDASHVQRSVSVGAPPRRPTLPPVSLLAATQVSSPVTEVLDDEETPGHFAELEPPLGTPADNPESSAMLVDDVHPDPDQPPPDGKADVAASGRRTFAPEAGEKAAFGAALGWQAAMAAPDALQATLPVASDHDGTADVAASSTPLADSDAVDLFFLDAHYDPSHVGSVYLIGKVRQGCEHVSACVVVSNIKQVLFVVPKPFVFQDSDGELARYAVSACLYTG